ncbi:MAG: hypothetical protein ACT4PX_03330 [Actinomycetota bacterium]
MRDEAGQVGGIEGLVFGVLVFVFGTLVVANAWGVIDAKLAVTSAAREAARTYVETTSEREAYPAALAASDAALTAHGRDRSRAELQIEVDGAGGPGRFARCARAAAEVRYVVPLVAIPLLGQAGNGITVTARHSEVVDPYRSGLPGTATCGG